MEVDSLIPKGKGLSVLAESRLPHPQHFGVEGYRRRNVSDCKNHVIKMCDHFVQSYHINPPSQRRDSGSRFALDTGMSKLDNRKQHEGDERIND